MSANSKNNEWDSLWGEYSKSLENWKAMFEQFQNASNEMQTKFNQVWEGCRVCVIVTTSTIFQHTQLKGALAVSQSC